MPKLAQLRKEAIEKIMNNMAMQEILRTHMITWTAPGVIVEDLLFEHPSENSVARVRKSKMRDVVVRPSPLWKNPEKHVGGSIVRCSSCEDTFWTPPSGSDLFRLQLPNVPFKINRYYLLVYHNQTYIIHQCRGERNALSIVKEGEYSPYLGSALQSIMSWNGPNQ